MSKKKVRHSPEQIVRKLRDADAMLNAGRDLAATLGSLSQGIPRFDVDLGATLKGVLDFANGRGGGAIVAEPLLLISDGKKGTWDRTKKIPLKSSTIDPRTGAISKSYTFVPAGLQIGIELRESSWRSARADFEISLGDLLSGGDGTVPLVTQELKLAVSADVFAGGVYLVGSLREGAGEHVSSGSLKFGGLQKREGSQVLVFARVSRIAGALVPDARSEGEPVMPAAAAECGN